MFKLKNFIWLLILTIESALCGNTTAEINHIVNINFHRNNDALLTSTAAAANNQIVNINLDFHCNDEVKAPFEKIGTNYYVVEGLQKENWFKASHICRQYNAHLVSIENSQEMDALNNYLIGNAHSGKYFWTSGNDLSEEGQFLWMGTGNAFGYTKWSTWQPDNNGKRENCVHLWVIKDDDKFTWNDANCETIKANFICESN